MSESSFAAAPERKTVRKAIGPGLRKLLYVVFALVAVLTANSAYLAGVTFLEWGTGRTYQDYFYLVMFLAHVVLGLLLVAPFIVFGLVHLRNTYNRKIRRTVRIGYALFFVCIAVLVTGILLVRLEGVFDLRNPTARSVVYWLHVACPIVGGWMYWLHRLVGPKIKWRVSLVFLGFTGLVVAGMLALQAQDPRSWNTAGPKEGEKYFFPSPLRSHTGDFIPADTLDMNHYCQKCHPDAHARWQDSVHRFSSFNNPAYLASIAETRKVSLERDGNVQASRWCAGCHDPVPFLSGAFDDPNFDMVRHPTAGAGITCTVCHAITHVNSNRGNADFTIEEPLHYPFAFSDNAVLQWVNNQLVKAKPSFHRKTFLKPFHRTKEFCSTCHKVSLPFALNHYKQFLRGQNHYDSHLLSGVSGHGARSFYYPPHAQSNCNGCHMPLQPSDDFGAKLFGDLETLSIHDHRFSSANTAVAWLLGKPDVIAAHQEFLDGVMRVDLFGVRDGGTIDSPLLAPIRPNVPELQPGKSYLLETVIRTVRMGHHFTQGTTDSNEIWLDVSVQSGERVIGRSGGFEAHGTVDPWSHFVNTFMLDRHGRRINRRNAQDIFVPLYSHQIPPGAGQTVHYLLQVPEDVSESITVEVRLQFRKFDTEYMQYVDRITAELGKPIRGHRPGEPYVNELPVTTLASDSVTFPLGSGTADVPEQSSLIPEWQRWNDYGIGLLLKGKAELRQAADAFRQVERLGRYDGPLNLTRVLFREAGPGQLDQAVEALQRAAEFDDPSAPPWTLAWLSGQINRQQGRLREAEQNFRNVLESRTAEMRRRGFDFSQDYVVNNLLGQTLFDRARQIRVDSRKQERQALLSEARRVFERTLDLDSENVNAHYNLQLLCALLGDAEQSAEHRRLHQIYKVDDTARGQAVGLAKQYYPAANHASEPLVIYDLHRKPSSADGKSEVGSLRD